jgi:hypothetical protein
MAETFPVKFLLEGAQDGAMVVLIATEVLFSQLVLANNLQLVVER